MAADHDLTETRLDKLEHFGVETQQRLGVVETQLKSISADMKTLIQTVSAVSSRPVHDWFKIMPALAAAVVIFTAVGSVITYIASNVNAAASARQEERLSFMQMRLDQGWFKPSNMAIRVPGGTVTPQ